MALYEKVADATAPYDTCAVLLLKNNETWLFSATIAHVWRAECGLQGIFTSNVKVRIAPNSVSAVLITAVIPASSS